MLGGIKALVLESFQTEILGEEVHVKRYLLEDGRGAVCAASPKHGIMLCYRFKTASDAAIEVLMQAAAGAAACVARAKSGGNPNLGFKEIDGRPYFVARGITPEQCRELRGVYSDGECLIAQDDFLREALAWALRECARAWRNAEPPSN